MGKKYVKGARRGEDYDPLNGGKRGSNGPAARTACAVVMGLLVIGTFVGVMVLLGQHNKAATGPVLVTNPEGRVYSEICPYPPRVMFERSSDTDAWLAQNQRLHRVTSDDGGWIAAMETGLEWDGMTGDEPFTLVFIHGFGQTSQNFWHMMASDKMRSLYRMIALDARGHGDSFHPPLFSDYVNKTLNARDMKVVLDHLQVTRPPLMVGHSLGCGIGPINYLETFGAGALSGFYCMDGAANRPTAPGLIFGPFITDVVVPLVASGANVGISELALESPQLAVWLAEVKGGQLSTADAGTTQGVVKFGDYLVNCKPPPELNYALVHETGTSSFLGYNDATSTTSRAARLGSLSYPVDAVTALAAFPLDKILVTVGLANQIYDPTIFIADWAATKAGIVPEQLADIGHSPHFEIPLWTNERICNFANRVYGTANNCAGFNPALPVSSPVVPWFDRPLA